MALYQIQVGDEPVYVEASSFEAALSKWRSVLIRDGMQPGDIEQPDSIACISQASVIRD